MLDTFPGRLCTDASLNAMMVYLDGSFDIMGISML